MIIDPNATLDILSHHGVKGMKWGVRQARKEVRNQAVTSRKIIKAAKTAKTKQERDAAVKDYEEKVIKRIRSKDFREAYHTANTVTKGDMAAQLLFLGPIGALTIPAMKAQSRQRQATGIDQELVVARNILKELQNS